MEGTGHKSQEGSQQQQLQGQNTGKLSVACLSLENDGETQPWSFFSLQVEMEAEGSGLGWGLDVSSGSGDLVPSEELLRVSVKG